MIATVTLNLALDVTYEVDAVQWHAANRVSAVRERAGGKGVNVARVLHALGHETLVSGFAGGPAGEAIRDDLAAAGVPARLTAVAGASRRTVAVVDAAAGDATGFWEPGPEISADEWEAFLRTYDGVLGESRAVVLSGSLPPGVPGDSYAELCRRARDAGVPAVLDADGAPLVAGLAGRPALIKPNTDELARAAGGLETVSAAPETVSAAPETVPAAPETVSAAPETVSAARDTISAAQRLRDAGVETVVVSRGAEGLLAVTPDGTWQATPVDRVSGNPTGAGDAAVAALTAGLVAGRSWPERLVDAVALSAAAVAAPLAGGFDDAVYRRQRERVRAEIVPA